ncbi:hypothetical protein D3C72_2111410 [compost metagenome]
MPTRAKNIASRTGRMMSCAAHRVNATAKVARITSDIGPRGREGGGRGADSSGAGDDGDNRDSLIDVPTGKRSPLSTRRDQRGG